jgi:hypothetical protein
VHIAAAGKSVVDVWTAKAVGLLELSSGWVGKATTTTATEAAATAAGAAVGDRAMSVSSFSQRSKASLRVEPEGRPEPGVFE